MSKPWLHVESEETPEGTTLKVRGTITDEDGIALAAADLDELTATLYDASDPANIVTDWDDRDVKDAGGGAFDGTTKEFTLRLPPEAMTLFNETRKTETHILILEWTYNGGDDQGYQEFQIPISNRPHRGTS